MSSLVCCAFLLCLSVCVSVCVSVCFHMSVCLLPYVCLSVCLCFCLSVCLTFLFIPVFLSFFFCLSCSFFIFLSISLFLSGGVHLHLSRAQLSLSIALKGHNKLLSVPLVKTAESSSTQDTRHHPPQNSQVAIISCGTDSQQMCDISNMIARNRNRTFYDDSVFC